jgi:transposase
MGQLADSDIEGLSSEIEALARQDQGCVRLMAVPGIGPIISSAMVAAIGTGDVFCKGRDFGSWLGLVPKTGKSKAIIRRRAASVCINALPTVGFQGSRKRATVHASLGGIRRMPVEGACQFTSQQSDCSQ